MDRRRTAPASPSHLAQILFGFGIARAAERDALLEQAVRRGARANIGNCPRNLASAAALPTVPQA